MYNYTSHRGAKSPQNQPRSLKCEKQMQKCDFHRAAAEISAATTTTEEDSFHCDKRCREFPSKTTRAPKTTTGSGILSDDVNVERLRREFSPSPTLHRGKVEALKRWVAGTAVWSNPPVSIHRRLNGVQPKEEVLHLAGRRLLILGADWSLNHMTITASRRHRQQSTATDTNPEELYFKYVFTHDVT